MNNRFLRFVEAVRCSRRKFLAGSAIILAAFALTACRAPLTTTANSKSLPEDYSFVTAGDMLWYITSNTRDKRYFDGLCEALQHIGAGEFMISPGDVGPPDAVRATLDRYLGTDYVWYPVIGNHELDTPGAVEWIRAWAVKGVPHLARRGPPGAEASLYSFDLGNSHFVAVDQYYKGAGKKADLSEATLDWLESDLAATRQPLIWVIAHSPIESVPDMDSGRVRHQGESVSTNAVRVTQFVKLLQKHHVRAFICGHTHNASVTKVKGVWQADSGHARGAGDAGSPSTFLKFRVRGTNAWVDVYRADKNGKNYRLRKTVELD